MATLLERAGFTAHHPWTEYLERYATAADDMELHKCIAIEESKEFASKSIPLTLLFLKHDSYYRSELLENRRKKILQQFSVSNFIELYDSNRNTPWIREIDPILFEKNREMYQHPHAHKAAFDDFIDQVAIITDDESHLYARSEKTFYTPENRFSAFLEASEERLGHLGFKCVARRKDYVALQVRIDDKFKIRWSIEGRKFLNTPRPNALLVPSLHIRRSGFEDFISSAKPDDFLEVPYRRLLDGFGLCYQRCTTIDEIRYLVAAHAILVEYIFPFAREAVEKCGRDTH